LTFNEYHAHPAACFDHYFVTILFRHVNLSCLGLISFLKKHLGTDKITSIALFQELSRDILEYQKLDCYTVTESLSEEKAKTTDLKEAFPSNNAEGLAYEDLKITKFQCESQD